MFSLKKIFRMCFVSIDIAFIFTTRVFNDRELHFSIKDLFNVYEVIAQVDAVQINEAIFTSNFHETSLAHQ